MGAPLAGNPPRGRAPGAEGGVHTLTPTPEGTLTPKAASSP